MTLVHILLVAMVLLVVLGLLSWTATRLDRMNHRVETARAALQAALLGRSAVALEFAMSGLLDPASSLLVADAAHRSRAAEPAALIRAETDLTQALRAAITAGAERDATEHDNDNDTDHYNDGVPVGPALDAETLAEIRHACLYVTMARRIHNDAVAHAVSLRRLRVVRYFRLAGHSVEPETIDFDDAIADLDS